MSKEKRRVPKLRFPGFTEDWEQCKLKSIANTIVAGGDIDKNKIKESGTYLVIANALTKDGVVGYYEDTYRIEAPAVTVTGRGDIGVAKARHQNFTPVVRLLSLTTAHDVDFIENAINNLKIVSESTGVAQLTVPQLSNYKIHITSILEERKIGLFISKVDNLITLHQRKLNNLKLKKKALFQKLFPKNGERYPELRFPGFTDAWEQCELEELCNIYDGTHQTPRYTNNGVMFVSVENIKTLESDKYISEDDFKSEFKISPEYGDILLTRIGDVGSANIILDNIKRAYYVSLALLKPKDISSLFLLALLASSSVQSEIWRRTLHIAFPKKINKNEIGKVIVNKPSIPEQKKIGELIYALDRTVTLHQRKLDHLQLQKKALLQQMFV